MDAFLILENEVPGLGSNSFKVTEQSFKRNPTSMMSGTFLPLDKWFRFMVLGFLIAGRHFVSQQGAKIKRRKTTWDCQEI